ncbi:mucin-15-like [Carassius auratus]|uniref:Mucin-15-like n=1 Tax=Carassius auratus TaxID=7957 RepID=A0A6P6KJ30_CARAU|nr:mucin-15-like [Carassius auratus]
MKLPLGITLALFLILQAFQQASTQKPEDWERYNGTTGTEGEQNSTKLDQMPEQSVADTEEASSDGPISTAPPPVTALNTSSEHLNTSAQSNETLTQDTATNTSTPEPEHTDESTLNDTYTSPHPETTTTESSHNETGSGYFPSDDVPSSSTTKSPTTTRKDESVQNETTVGPTQTPAHRSTTAAIRPTVSENVTTPALPESEETNQTDPTDTRENSERGLSSDVTESRKGQAWTVVLVIGIIVGVLALGAFIIMNRRNKRDFSHRKLEEEMSPDPVLRLDNSEPLDLKFEGFGYNNPGLQGDNIQMANFPQGHSK